MAHNERSVITKPGSTAPEVDADIDLPIAAVGDTDATRIMPTGGPTLGLTPKRSSEAPPTPAPPTSSMTGTPAAPHRDETVNSLPGAALPAHQTLPGASQPGGLAMRQVGRYLIGERLGRGGMATVFKAHDPNIDRDVAIKFLHATLCQDEEYHARFLREARAAGGLSDPNIVTVHDVGEIEGRPYMAMELIDGQPLSDDMAEGKPLPVRDVVVMGIQLARALAYAHGRGIVHRDIKPANLMRVKGTLTIKVTDFGIAHMESAGSQHRTRVGDILGTPQYMSPEQAQGEKLDGRSDLFSTGILLYQMLTGQRPFLGDSLVALAVKIAKDEPIAIEKLRPDLPSSLRRIVGRCLAKAPQRRFQTGSELADALGRVLVEIDEQQRQQNKQRIIPLRVKWAAMMALIVAAVMALTATIITQRQYAAMVNQVVDSGAALARFIAAQNAVAALSEDWASIDVSVQEIMRTGDFHAITVIDREGVVRASSQRDLLGSAYKAPVGKPLAGHEDGLPVLQYVSAGESVLGFEAPITFQNKRVGRVALALAEKPLVQVARLSMGLMGVLVLVTVAAVALAMYFVANWFAQPIKLLGDSMAEIAKGRFDHRIREQRMDEFGELYAEFDRMAQALQDRQAGAYVTTSDQRSPETSASSDPSPESGISKAG